jgi:Caspase recruitment domain
MNVTNFGLLDELYELEVIDRCDREVLEAEPTPTGRSEKLLTMLSKASSDKWEQFLGALDRTQQGHLTDEIRGKQTKDLPGFVLL